jgi:hypothetical protein
MRRLAAIAPVALVLAVASAIAGFLDGPRRLVVTLLLILTVGMVGLMKWSPTAQGGYSSCSP